VEVIRRYASRGNQRGGSRQTFLFELCYGHEKIAVAGGVERMYHPRQFPSL
jgi:hypothetical protein